MVFGGFCSSTVPAGDINRGAINSKVKFQSQLNDSGIVTCRDDPTKIASAQ
jgi:hypothetical protein